MRGPSHLRRRGDRQFLVNFVGRGGDSDRSELPAAGRKVAFSKTYWAFFLLTVLIPTVTK